MSDVRIPKFEKTHKWMSLLPYGAFGILVFALSSGSELNFYLRGYLLLLAAQAGMISIYFIKSQLEKKRKI